MKSIYIYVFASFVSISLLSLANYMLFRLWPDIVTEMPLAASVSRLPQQVVQDQLQRTSIPAKATDCPDSLAMASVEPSSTTVQIETPEWHSDAGRTTVSFVVRNYSVEPVEGKVFGFGSFVANDGQRYLIGSHEDLIPGAATGAGDAFRASKYTRKALSFPHPKDMQGRVVAATIYAQSKDERVSRLVPLY